MTDLKERPPLRYAPSQWVRRHISTPRQSEFLGEVLRHPLCLPAVATHRYWSGDPRQPRTKRFHVARPDAALTVWVDRSWNDATPVFDHMIVRTRCALDARFPVDPRNTDLILCPVCAPYAEDDVR